MNRLNMYLDGNAYGQYVHRQLFMKEKNQENLDVTTYILISTYVMLTQMSAQAGIKKVGEHAVADMLKEFKQLNYVAILVKPVFGTINPDGPKPI